MSDLPTSWGSGRVSIDTENRDDLLSKLGPGVRRGAFIAGVSFAIEDGPSFYLPVRHGDGGNLDPDQVMNYLRHVGKQFDGSLCGANLGYDLDFLEEEGVTFPRVKWFRDVMVADPLINELHMSYSLESISQRWDIPGKNESLLLEALGNYGYHGSRSKAGIWALHSRFVGAYAERDAKLPLDILRRQEREIDNQDLWEVYNLESRVLPCLVRMRRRGVAVSEDRLDQVASWAREQQQMAIEAANQYTTHTLSYSDITNTGLLARVLTDLGVNLPKTATGKDSVTAKIMETLNHPIGEHLRRAKKMSTLRTTFVDGVRKHLTNGRAHCTFNQLRRQKDDESDDTEGAAYGRLSSSNFNFQNQPARDEEIGPMWRSIYIPDDGGLWASLDYSQQEPRQAVHFAVEVGPEVIGHAAHVAALEAARRFHNDPTTDFHQMMADMAGIERKPAKAIFLGLSYGMGGAKLCRDLKLPTAWRMGWLEGRKWNFRDYEDRQEAMEKADAGRVAGYKTRCWEVAGPEGQQLMDTFDSRVPFVRKMSNYMQSRAEAVGYITTLAGRRCRFPKKDSGEWDWVHKAFNRLIQGSSADQTKMAVVALEDAGYELQLQVHDEVDLTVSSRAQAQQAARIMEEVVPLHVPMRVDVEVGPSWGEIA